MPHPYPNDKEMMADYSIVIIIITYIIKITVFCIIKIIFHDGMTHKRYLFFYSSPVDIFNCTLNNNVSYIFIKTMKLRFMDSLD